VSEARSGLVEFKVLLPCVSLPTTLLADQDAPGLLAARYFSSDDTVGANVSSMGQRRICSSNGMEIVRRSQFDPRGYEMGPTDAMHESAMVKNMRRWLAGNHTKS